MRAAIVAFFVLLAGVTETCAQDRFAQIDAQQQQLDRVATKIHASMGRVLQTARTSSSWTPTQELTMSYLSATHESLKQADLQLSALYKLLMMQQLVTGAPQLRLARKIVDQHRDYIVKGVSSRVTMIEGFVAQSSDEETSRLLFEARDALKATSEFAQRP